MPKTKIEPVLGIKPILKEMGGLEPMSGNIKITAPITDYKIIQGLPGAVELEVKILLKLGWELNGAMYAIKTPLDNHNGIVVQCMINTAG